jgi:hypothetical protein
VFREIQYKNVDVVPTDGGTSVSRNRSDGLVLHVNRTWEGGPVSVQVRDLRSDDRVNGRVSIDGFVVGGTGTDGTVWTVTPDGPFTVTVRAGDRQVSVGPLFPRQRLDPVGAGTG